MGPVVHSRSKKLQLGHSISTTISELVNFVRSMPADTLNTIINSCLKQYIDDTVSLDLFFGIVATVGGWNS
jgi:hypothetical protein